MFLLFLFSFIIDNFVRSEDIRTGHAPNQLGILAFKKNAYGRAFYAKAVHVPLSYTSAPRTFS